VKSNKRERAAMLASVRADEFSLTEAHIRLVCQRRYIARVSVCSGAASANVRQANESIKVRNLRWVADIRQRDRRIQSIMVDKHSEGSKSGRPARNRFDDWPSRKISSVIIVVPRMCRRRGK